MRKLEEPDRKPVIWMSGLISTWSSLAGEPHRRVSFWRNAMFLDRQSNDQKTARNGDGEPTTAEVCHVVANS
ncbi:MAG: hypothetical protein MZV49_07040 [Rhodopseudomonas palustris]|nr:hypothetical protein [Rhodopseudomonas palustris]